MPTRGVPKRVQSRPLFSAASAKEDAKWLQWVTRQFEMIAGLTGLAEAGTGLVLLSWVLYVRGSRSIDADELRTVL
ncbi:hypothetical protein CB1_000359008 [Camelus ferus]|nr:hypothetical protein CB1_000359008 [Camelus ferus]